MLNLTPGVQNVQNENSIGLPMEHVIINGSSDNMVGQVTYYLDGGPWKFCAGPYGGQSRN
jgi:hypothetical protein